VDIHSNDKDSNIENPGTGLRLFVALVVIEIIGCSLEKSQADKVGENFGPTSDKHA
jgi:hypothetical protein